MEELYSIMRDLLEVEYNQKLLIYILKAAESTDMEEIQAEAKSIANSTKYYLKALQKDLRTVINRLDSYIAEHAKK